MQFYSNGKLLLTGEYVVLDGATSLAVPTKFGQDLVIEPIKEPQLIWGSFTHTGDCWFEASFDLPKLRLTSATFNSDKAGSAEFIAETLRDLLQEAKRLNPDFLSSNNGFIVKTNLTFPRNWGLGSSSTLINNIADWAKVNPFTLLWNAFSGSGYDIACAKYNTPVFYQLENSLSTSLEMTPIITEVEFSPNFNDELYFVYLNQKQNSRDGIAQYRKYQNEKPLDSARGDIRDISALSKELVNTTSSKDIDKIIIEHERIISSIIKLSPVKNSLFSDYFGEVKSLGAWGGDFVLATGNEDTPKYFQQKGFDTIIPYSKMVL